MVVQHLHTVPGVSSNLTFTTSFGGSSGLRGILARFLTRRVRFPRPPPNFSPTRIMVLHLFCNQDTAVRFCRGAPSFVRVSARESHAIKVSSKD